MWAEFRRDLCLDDWEGSDNPTHEEKIATYLCIMDLRQDPRPATSVIVNHPHTPEARIADVAATALVCILYTIYDDEHAIEYLMIERITP